MKKILLFLLLFSGFLLSAVDQERSWKLSPLQIGLGISDFKNLADQSADTVFTFGLWYMEQKSAVISFSTCTEFQNNYGIQLSILQALSDKNYGIMTGFTTGTLVDNYGIKLGLFNVKGKFDHLQILGIDFFDLFYAGLLHLNTPVSIGLVNVCDKSKDNAVFQAGILNYNSKGVQIGLVNVCDKSKDNAVFQAGILNYNSKGVQIGLGNIEGAYQFGLFNYHSKKTTYSWEKPDNSGVFQFGLLNYNEKSYVPWFPLINFNMGR